MKYYTNAQKGIAKLKDAVYEFLAMRGKEGATNAEIGRALGIYTGYSTREDEPLKKAQEGHISRAILGYMETEEVVCRKDKKWVLRQYSGESRT